jgi:hypothetical protein
VEPLPFTGHFYKAAVKGISLFMSIHPAIFVEHCDFHQMEFCEISCFRSCGTAAQGNNPPHECLCTYMYTWLVFVVVMECAVRFEVLVAVLVKIILLGCDDYDWARISWLFKDNSVFFFLDCLTLKMKALWSFKTLRNTCPVTQCHIPEGLNLWTVFSQRYRLRLKE